MNSQDENLFVAQDQTQRFSGEYNLPLCRRQRGWKDPAAHQKSALNKLNHWFRQPIPGDRGGILVLPTGAGKTFTASHFLCRCPLSQGYKVLWLAHTHHLLEQAFFGLNEVVSLIAEPAQSLRVRVISGTPGHCPLHSINTSDDIVIATLQTVCLGFKARHQQLERFIDSAGEKLFVVFDEAHHSPAPSYRNLIGELRKRCPH